jgi:prepilin-type N-terminal cleavage/methylation domain-containing protein
MTCRRTSNRSGFTIIELMIATAVFSVVLLLCATALVTIGNMYRRGITAVPLKKQPEA